MSLITSAILQKVAPGTKKETRDRFIPYFNECLPRYGITSELRVAAFLTTVCFESDYFRATEEYASGKDYDITVNRKKAIGLGNTEPGDGVKYKGRTLIQTTGKKNYQRLTDKFGLKNGVDFVANPKKLAELRWAVEGACVYWEDNKLNSYADKGKFFAVQGLVNRGSPVKEAKDYSKRLEIYQNVLNILPETFQLKNGVEDSNKSEPTQPSVSNIPDSLTPVQTQVIEVPQVAPAVEPPKEEEKKEDVLTRIGNKAVAVWTAIGTGLMAIFTWLSSLPLSLIGVVLGAIILAGLSWMVINALRQNAKDKRDAASKLEQERQEAELKAQREKQAFELQKLTLESAMRKDMNTVTIVPTPITNSDTPEE